MSSGTARRTDRKPWDRSWSTFQREWEGYSKGAGSELASKPPKDLAALLASQPWKGSTVENIRTNRAEFARVVHPSGAEVLVFVRWLVWLDCAESLANAQKALVAIQEKRAECTSLYQKKANTREQDRVRTEIQRHQFAEADERRAEMRWAAAYTGWKRQAA